MHQKEIKLKIQLLSPTGHTSSTQWPHVASGCHIGQGGYRTFPSLKRSVDSTTPRIPSQMLLPLCHLLPAPALRASGLASPHPTPTPCGQIEPGTSPNQSLGSPPPPQQLSNPPALPLLSLGSQEQNPSLLSGPTDTPASRMQSPLKKGEEKNTS